MSSTHLVRLGKSELKVSPICFGTWQLSPKFWGEQSQSEISSAIQLAYDLGINFIDTADAYGDGLAEQVVGKAIKSLPREKLVIATKVYNHFYPDGSRHGDLSSDYILKACDDSLRRLDLDYIDLYQCHAFDPLVRYDELAETLNSLVKAGKIRAYGVSNWSVEQMRTGSMMGNYATCQPVYSLLKRDIEKDILPYCQGNDIGTLIYSSLHLGLLTGKYKGHETFTDVRQSRPDFQGERYKLICERVQQVGEIAKKYDLTTVQLVLAVTLMHPGITSAIVGIKTQQQIKEAAGAMGKTVSIVDWNQVRTLLTV